ncbi:MAG: o-succinylbenzoate synthase [Acidobacteria bacterium]|nr:o-succinylbenzoate synthase [Acidobacteriota bacterium]
MQIDRVTLTHCRIPLVEPFRISNGVVAEKDGIVVQVESEGLRAFGESSPMAGSFYSGDTPESCWRDLCETLIPRALLHGRWDSLEAACQWIDALPGVSNFAKVGLETALWDLEAQRRGVSLAALLGGTRTAVESGLAVGLYSNEAALHAAIEREITAAGYKRVKVKIAPGHDVDLVAGVARRFPGVPLMTDANAAYTIADAPVFEKLDAHGMLMFEQPLAGAAFEDSAALQRRVRTPVCFDESLESPADVTRAAELDACRIANIKIQRVGGLANALEVYRRAQAAGMGLWVGTMPELGVGCAAGVHLAALDGITFPTDVEASARWFRDDLIEPGIEVRDGLIHVPTAPGLGYHVSEEKLRRYQVARQEFRG